MKRYCMSRAVCYAGVCPADAPHLAPALPVVTEHGNTAAACCMLCAAQACAPLMLCAPDGTQFEMRGAVHVALGDMAAEQLLAPPGAVGDPAATLSTPALVNQVSHCGTSNLELVWGLPISELVWDLRLHEWGIVAGFQSCKWNPSKSGHPAPTLIPEHPLRPFVCLFLHKGPQIGTD